MHLLSYFLVGKTNIHIVHFRRIFFQIIKFPCIWIVIKMNQLITISTNTMMTLYIILTRKFVICIINGISPFTRFSTYDLPERFSLYILRNINTCIILKSGSKIKILSMYLPFLNYSNK